MAPKKVKPKAQTINILDLQREHGYGGSNLPSTSSGIAEEERGGRGGFGKRWADVEDDEDDPDMMRRKPEEPERVMDEWRIEKPTGGGGGFGGGDGGGGRMDRQRDEVDASEWRVGSGGGGGGGGGGRDDGRREQPAAEDFDPVDWRSGERGASGWKRGVTLPGGGGGGDSTNDQQQRSEAEADQDIDWRRGAERVPSNNNSGPAWKRGMTVGAEVQHRSDEDTTKDWRGADQRGGNVGSISFTSSSSTCPPPVGKSAYVAPWKRRMDRPDDRRSGANNCEDEDFERLGRKSTAVAKEVVSAVANEAKGSFTRSVTDAGKVIRSDVSVSKPVVVEVDDVQKVVVIEPTVKTNNNNKSPETACQETNDDTVSVEVDVIDKKQLEATTAAVVVEKGNDKEEQDDMLPAVGESSKIDNDVVVGDAVVGDVGVVVSTTADVIGKNKTLDVSDIGSCDINMLKLFYDGVMQSVDSEEVSAPDMTLVENCGETVASIVVCSLVLAALALRRCCSCHSREQVQLILQPLQPAFQQLFQKTSIEAHYMFFLQKTVCFASRLGLPRIDENWFLLDAFWDSLYSLDVIEGKHFCKWFDDVDDAAEGRQNSLFQVHKWCNILQTNAAGGGLTAEANEEETVATV
eukprot:GHVS01023158.1.p1 GENE.GHVS01023158.1~~GHVS01023158.1.p1  ORF type:complete len:633 (-),score=183.02 GHVS01023158.1:536-2434(-)